MLRILNGDAAKPRLVRRVPLRSIRLHRRLAAVLNRVLRSRDLSMTPNWGRAQSAPARFPLQSPQHFAAIYGQ
jgi:hypothetical protein